MEFHHLPFDATLAEYEKQAAGLFEAYHAKNPKALDVFRRKHPRFLDKEIKWLSLNSSDEEIQAAQLNLDDARLAIARKYDFLDWKSLADWVAGASQKRSYIHLFESAVEAVITGDAENLRTLLRNHPGLVRAQSTRACCFDPPQHRATLLHYIAANGVEGYRQKTPKNAVEIARILLEAGIDPDALAYMYGGESTTLPMLVSSSHPAEAGVQVALVDLLADFGASLEPRGKGNWTSPLMTALVFGMAPAAEVLVRRGAKITNIAEAAGLGRIDDVKRMLPAADGDSRHRAFAIAAQLGRTEIVRLLLDSGEDPNRYNPPAMHTHSTPIHQAVAGDHEDIVRLLAESGADLTMKDKIFKGTPLGWADYLGKKKIADYLRSLATTA